MEIHLCRAGRIRRTSIAEICDRLGGWPPLQRRSEQRRDGVAARDAANTRNHDSWPARRALAALSWAVGRPGAAQLRLARRPAPFRVASSQHHANLVCYGSRRYCPSRDGLLRAELAGYVAWV